jgi:uncharacterized protein (TIGR03435 family)
MIEDIRRNLSFIRRLLLLVAGSMAAGTPSILGQGSATSSGTAPLAATTDVKLPAFDVVSIKPNKSDSGMIRVMYKPDGYSATNISLKMLILGAYGLKEDQLSGLPIWADSARYDIDAKVAGADVAELQKLKNDQRRLLLLPLLADRFKLTVHNETKILPIYELVVAKNGSKLKEATPGDTYANGVKGPDGVGRAGMMTMRPGQLAAQAVPVTSLVNILSQQLHRTVMDKTGLTGKYDIALQWTQDEGLNPMFKGTDGSPQRAEPPPDASGPSIFTAVQEQLGLRLQSSRGPVQVVVIDHVEMPSEN